MQSRLRRRALLLTALVGVGAVACELPEGPDLDPLPTIPLGRYVLISRGGAPLPSALNAGPGASASLRGDTLRLLEAGQFTRVHHVLWYDSGTGFAWSVPIAGSFVVSDTTVTLSTSAENCPELEIVRTSETLELQCQRFGQLGVYVRDSGGVPAVVELW